MSTSQSAYDYSTKGMLSSGVTGFAAIMLMAVGCFQVLQGIAAIAQRRPLRRRRRSTSSAST